MKPLAFMTVLLGVSGMLAIPAHAEIVLPPDGGESVLYAYEHPALRSFVFISNESRQMAILPPSPFFIAPPPLLMRAPGLMPAYPPAPGQTGFNAGAHPSSRDNNLYLLERAHAFSQRLYRSNKSGNAPILAPYAVYAAYGGAYYPYGNAYGMTGYGSAYPPLAAPGFNAGQHPSNRDNNTYLLERAHRFSMDGYRRP